MFSFVHAWLALGALGGAIPVLIHLLNRRRFQVVRWAAMEFLLASLRKNYRRIRFENLLLLLLRILMVVLMALALARPRVTESGVLGALGTESRHVVLLLDGSLSMRHRDGPDTAFDRAKRVAEEILAGLRQGDICSILRVSDRPRAIIKEPTPDIEWTRDEVRRLEPGWGGTDLRRALVAAAELLGATTKPRKDLFLITDMQAAGWGRPEKAPGAELRAALDRITKEAKVFLVDVGAEAPANLAVTELRPSDKIVGVDSPTEFKVTVSNFSRTAPAAVRVRFLVDGFDQDVREIDIPAGKSRTVEFIHSFRTRGAHLVQAELGDDRLAADNVRYLAVYAEASVPVLLVNGETAADPAESETFYLEWGLNPPAEKGAPRLSHIEPRTITEFGLSAVDFGRYRLVVLANLASLAGGNTVARLEDYVRQGGALVVFLGDRIDTAFYNEQLFREGQGLLPARLGGELGGLGENKKGVHVELTKPVHPAFELFTGDRALLVNRLVLFYKYFDLRLPKRAEDVRVVARFEDGRPAVVEKRFGRGRVVLFASTADAEWTNFGPSGALPVVMHELVGYLATADFRRRNVQVGRPYRRTFAPEELVEVVAVHPPGAGSTAVTLKPYARGAARPAAGKPDERPVVTEILFRDTRRTGPYELEIVRKDGTTSPKEYFAVNPPPEESDLRRYTPDEALRAIPGLTFRYAKSVPELRLAVRRARSGRDFSRVLLFAVLAIACVELVLGQRFGR